MSQHIFINLHIIHINIILVLPLLSILITRPEYFSVKKEMIKYLLIDIGTQIIVYRCFWHRFDFKKCSYTTIQSAIIQIKLHVLCFTYSLICCVLLGFSLYITLTLALCMDSFSEVRMHEQIQYKLQEYNPIMLLPLKNKETTK